MVWCAFAQCTAPFFNQAYPERAVFPHGSPWEWAVRQFESIFSRAHALFRHSLRTWDIINIRCSFGAEEGGTETEICL